MTARNLAEEGNDATDSDEQILGKSLIIPITSSTSSDKDKKDDLKIEIFPEEVVDIPSSTMISVLKEEDAELNVWADAALLYVNQKHEREGSEVLLAACEDEAACGNREFRVRTLASAGIAHLAHLQASLSSQRTGTGSGAASSSSDDAAEEMRALADQRFTHAFKVDQFFPMTWVGRGMLNLSMGRLEQARFFFKTTLDQCGQVLPALLGMAAVMYAQKDYAGCQALYAKAMTLFPQKSGAATRVGYGLACYQLGQVDRAKAAFSRAMAMDPNNVDAIVSKAVLDMASLDENLKDYAQLMEQSIKLLSMANLMDHSNSMVQNHLANHFFSSWTPVSGTVRVEEGSTTITASQPMNLETGDLIRLGTDFETYVTEEEANEQENENAFIIRDAWKKETTDGVKLWKRDYDRVMTLAKGVYRSTVVPEIQAESLFLMARVHHVQGDFDNAREEYFRACKLAPGLSPARFGLAQTLIAKGSYDDATAHLRLVLGTSSTATDALAALGLLEVKGGKKRKEALSCLKKAIDLDPLNPNLILLEALALQQEETDYPQSLTRYKKAVQLLETQGAKVSHEVLTNMGVLCHETSKYDEALTYYLKALDALDDSKDAQKASLDNERKEIRHKDNSAFFQYVDSGLKVEAGTEESGTETVKLVQVDDVSALTVRVGDHVKVGDNFETEVTEIVPKIPDDADSKVVLRLKDKYKAPTLNEGEEPVRTFSVLVKRENRRLENPTAITITFNLARLHEVTGRTIPAVELHKAIIRLHPSYVNSYLRLACIARDCGSLKDCSEWLKSACTVAPGNPEVLTLVGNLHLSLCDWAPAQSVFDQLLTQKIPNVEAYSMLSLGNIYFNNLKVPKRYAKHLQYAADFYRRILARDKTNAFAANGLGSVMAEKGDLIKAKEVFHRVREVSGDTIPDTLLNLGHIHLAQKKHPEAIQMYQSYISRTRHTGAPTTSKSQEEDDAAVLLYIAFAYFDWARQTEQFKNAKAATADGYYRKCIEHIQLASLKKDSPVLKFNMCTAKLHAANSVLQKLERNIRRTAQEVEEALKALEESLEVVQSLLHEKNAGGKVTIGTSLLNSFITNCKANIESAKSHLEEERKKEIDMKELRELQTLEAETQRKARELEEQVRKEKEAQEQEERDKKAKMKMDKVHELRETWIAADEAKQAAAMSKKKKGKGDTAPAAEDEHGDIFDNEVEVPPSNTAVLFDESDEDDEEPAVSAEKQPQSGNETKSDSDDEAVLGGMSESASQPKASETDLFGDSDEESDEDLIANAEKKRDVSEAVGETDDAPSAKKRRVLEDADSE